MNIILKSPVKRLVPGRHDRYFVVFIKLDLMGGLWVFGHTLETIWRDTLDRFSFLCVSLFLSLCVSLSFSL